MYMLPMPARLRLVEQRLPRSGGRGRARSRRSASSSSQSGPSRSGPRWPTTSASCVRRHELDDAEARSRRRPAALGAAAPPGPASDGRRHFSPAAVDVPGALHLQVRVEGPRLLVVDAGEQVLAARERAGSPCAPVRSTVACWGTRKSVAVSTWPVSARSSVRRRPDRRCRPQARILSPFGVATKPASSRAARSGVSRRRAVRRRRPLDDELAQCTTSRGIGQSADGGRDQPVGVVAPGQQGASAALDVQGEVAVHEHDQGAGLASRAVPVRRPWRRRVGGLPAPRRLRPGQRRAVGVGRVGRPPG